MRPIKSFWCLLFLGFALVGVQAEAYADIIDNRDVATASSGRWQPSGAKGFYGADSVYGQDGATFTWNFAAPQTGDFNLAMWWTTSSLRSTAVPVAIQHDGGATEVRINQQQNGGKWNLLGKYAFTAGKTYKVTLTAQARPSTTSADAVRFEFSGGAGGTPRGVIDSIGPSPSRLGAPVNFAGHGTDSGSVVAYRWESDIDGLLSDSAAFSTDRLSHGTHTITFKVQDKDGWSPAATSTLDVAEYISVLPGYGPLNPQPGLTTWLTGLGAYPEGNDLIYRNTARNRTFRVQFIRDIVGMKSALMIPKAHILFYGHSNYGLGPIFASQREFALRTITNFRYIDDDRILKLSAPWVAVSTTGMRTGQAYPYWRPIYQDGSLGNLPYEIGETNANGSLPPFNAYVTYPCSTPAPNSRCMVGEERLGAVERFPDARTADGDDIPAWFDPSGSEPNPDDADQAKYFITNSRPWAPSTKIDGSWVEAWKGTGFFKENYHYSAKGSGRDQFTFKFQIPQAGSYRLYAWWPAATQNAFNAPYTIHHDGGSTTVRVNQKANGGKWNLLGDYSFGVGEHSVVVSDDVGRGNVVADGLRVVFNQNPPQPVVADFTAQPRCGTAPLTVNFRNRSNGDLTGRVWTFDKDHTNSSRDDIDYIYGKPGIYDVSLTVTGPAGSDTKSKAAYIYVGDACSEPPPLQAEFRASSRTGTPPLKVQFRNESMGDAVSYAWWFGDEAGPIDPSSPSSTDRDPLHTYASMGNYTVTLRVTDGQSHTVTETKRDYVRVYFYDKSQDNVDYPKPHYGSKVIVAAKKLDVAEQDLKYARLFYLSCNSGNYFIDTLHRGVMFYDISATESDPAVGFATYLRAWFDGKTNQEIWEALHGWDPVFDYVEFPDQP